MNTLTPRMFSEALADEEYAIVDSYQTYYQEFINEYNSLYNGGTGDAENEARRLKQIVYNWYVSQKVLYFGLAELEMAIPDRGLAAEITINSEAAFDRCEPHIARFAYAYLAHLALVEDGIVVK